MYGKALALMKLDRNVEAKKEFKAFLGKYSTDDKAAQAKVVSKELNGPARPAARQKGKIMKTANIRPAVRRISGAGRSMGSLHAKSAGQTGSGTQTKAPAPFNLVKVADDLYVIDGGGAGNVAVYITNEGVIMVDDKFEQHFDEIMANVKKVTNQPVKYILSTHYHADHSGGNTRFSSIAEIISTRNAHDGIVQHKQSNAPANMVPARITFTQETDLFLGGKEVRAKYYGRGHTNGDAFVYFPALKVLHTGDMFTSATPLIDYPGGGSLIEWTKTLDADEERSGLRYGNSWPWSGFEESRPAHVSQQRREDADSRSDPDSPGQESGRRRQVHDRRVQMAARQPQHAVEPAGDDDRAEVNRNLI